ncbi:MAG TPA: N-acetylmuramoyl-L-alanine amidase [Solirubrobacteraceae bacterium]|nr:N-acetylmuramoyl-L-alanine amidase [Solirubrobacteraceae bacterium]
MSSARPLTRRTLLTTAAAATAGTLLRRPAGALAALGSLPPHTALERRPIGSLGPGGATVELQRSADLVGVEWQGPADAALQLRFRIPGTGWSAWASAASHGHGPEAQAPHGRGERHVGDPIWTGGTVLLQLRATRALADVRLHLVDASGGIGARRLALTPIAAAAALPLAAPVYAAGPGQPPIIARRAWARRVSPPRVAPAYGAVRMAFVHHTENPNGYLPGEVPAMLRAIYAFHRYVNGWNDIGYNFVVDLYGRIFEARAGGIDEPVVGAHAGGYNLASTGVAVLGSFMSVPISSAARGALERLLAWKLALHGVSAQGRTTVRVNPAGAVYSRFRAGAHVSLPRIAGHRDGDSTDCPGNVLYGELPGIRTGVQTLAPNPVLATLGVVSAAAAPVEPAPGTSTAPPPPAPTPGTTLAGALTLLDGTPLAGAPIAVQLRTVRRRGELVSEQTVAQAVTDAQGQWSLPAPAITGRGRVWLRVLYLGAPGSSAAVSAPLLLPAAAPLSAPPAEAPSPPTAAPPAP